jgi:hypothetical protein
MGDFRNKFSWSWSRRGTFEQCKRKYWLNYYGYWGGWSRESEPRQRELYVQKNLTTKPMWLGNCVHDAAEWALLALDRDQFIDCDEMVRRVLIRAKGDIASSESGDNFRDPKRKCGFQEHYYGGDKEVEWGPTLEEIERQVRNLYINPIFCRMFHVPERVREVEELHLEKLAGFPVYVKLDALMDDGTGGLVIIDWKTGKRHDADVVARQLGVYGLYARDILGVTAHKLKMVHVNLRDNKFDTHDISEEMLLEAAATVASSANAMKALTSSENEAQESDFPKLPEGDKACTFCNFRRDCGRE